MEVGNNDLIRANTEIKELKEVMESMGEDSNKIFNELRDKNKNLQMQLISILKCDDCGTTCESKEQMMMHMTSHQGVKEFVCSECGKIFNTISELDTHANEQQTKRLSKAKFFNREIELRRKISEQRYKLNKDLIKLRKT